MKAIKILKLFAILIAFTHQNKVCNLLDDKVKFQAFQAKKFNISKIPNNFTSYFIFNADEQLRNELTSKYKIKIEEAHKGSTALWKLDKLNQQLTAYL